MRKIAVDKLFLGIVVILVSFGFFIYISAALGLVARDSVRLSSVVLNHIGLGLCLGTILLILGTRIPYKFWRKHSFYILIGALVFSALVFIPGLGFEHGGARRWIHVANFSFQPSELLKIAYLIYVAAWISGVKEKVATMRYGILPFLAVSTICGALILSQPDTDTFLVMLAAGFAMLVTGGAKIRHVLLLGLVSLGLLALLATSRPYVMDRITTFFNPTEDPLGSGYQVQQSLIAIGSGSWFGKGFGQSVQKFNYLPEPIGDSIFAVAAEEFGFIGMLVLLLLYTAFALRGLKIAATSPDIFSSLLVCGIITMVIVQSFMNIAAMLAVIPLSGLPLIFVSHGGTAMAVTLFAIGIILNISKYVRK